MLEKDIKKAVIEDLKSGWIFPDFRARQSPIIRDAYDRRIISDEDIEAALHTPAVEFGRKSYEFCTQKPRQFQPDHFLSEELAYALAVGAISQKERGRLRFCHGETIDSFIKDFLPEGPKAYLQGLRKKVLGQDKNSEEDTWGMTVKDDSQDSSDFSYDPHPACFGH